MAEASADTPKPPVELTEEAMRKMYVRLLMQMVEGHGQSTVAAQTGILAFAKDPTASIGQDLIDLIKTLCDCKAVIVILECLCRLFTGGRVAGPAEG